MPSEIAPLRGEVWLIAFGPAVGGEIQKTRPAVIVSNDTANHLINRVQVVPVSSQTDRLYPAEFAIVLNGQRRKVMADQIATVSKNRLQRRMARLSPEDMDGVERAMRIQLGL